MKSLEETIKQKCKFLGNSQKHYGLYYFTAPINTSNVIRLFLIHSNIESESIVTLLEEIIPLFVYIYSCLKYIGCNGTVDISLKLKFRNSKLIYKELIDLSGHFLDNPVHEITGIKDSIKSRGYYNTFSEPFRVEIMLSINYGLRLLDSHEEETLTEEFTREEEYDSMDEPEYEPDDEDEEEEEEEEVINVTKTFKTEECVICIENRPNILFCNCGHLCICNNCLEFKKLSKCPVCKTENTILRIIE